MSYLASSFGNPPQKKNTKKQQQQKNKNKRFLGTAVFLARVLSAEITAGITSLFSTCRHFAGKQPAECKGRNSLIVLAKNLKLRQLTKYRIFATD